MKYCPCLNEEKFLLSSFANATDAQAFADNFGEKHGFCSFFAPMSSFYIWQNQCHHSAEVAWMGYGAASFPSVASLKAAHVYDTPELLFSAPVADSLPAALSILDGVQAEQTAVFAALKAWVLAKKVACAQYFAADVWGDARVFLKTAQPLAPSMLDECCAQIGAKTSSVRPVFAEKDYAAWLRDFSA